MDSLDLEDEESKEEKCESAENSPDKKQEEIKENILILEKESKNEEKVEVKKKGFFARILGACCLSTD